MLQSWGLGKKRSKLQRLVISLEKSLQPVTALGHFWDNRNVTVRQKDALKKKKRFITKVRNQQSNSPRYLTRIVYAYMHLKGHHAFYSLLNISVIQEFDQFCA